MHSYEKELIRNHPLYKELSQQAKVEREIEATKKKISEKSSMIARFMGSEIRSPGFHGNNDDAMTYNDQKFDFDVYEDYYSDNEIIETTEDGFGVIGWEFDALSYGCNMQITLFIDSHSIVIKYDGIMVFEESVGELTTYLPSLKWESKIEHWYKKAEQLKKKYNLVEEKKEEYASNGLLQNIKKLLTLTWGI